MNLNKTVMATTVIAILATSSAQAGWWKRHHQQTVETTPVVQPVVELSDLEEQDLTFMREEEKLARDVYTTLGARWDQPVFDNISNSEQRHMNSMANLLAKYAILDPVIDDSTGAFVNTDLGGLYEDLTTEGSESLLDALMVGARIEEIDILDLQRAIGESTHADLIEAYENLMRGSRNHLRAFVRQIENLGVAYEAQVMEQDEVDAILDSPMERGRSGGKRFRR